MFQHEWHKDASPEMVEFTYRQDIVRFIEDQFYMPDINSTVTLATAQKAFIRKATGHTDGVIDYNVVAYTALKKSLKTGLTAARSIWTCLSPNKQVFFIARSREQAQDRAFTMVKQSLQENPYPEVDRIKTTEVIFTNGSSIKCLPCTIAVAGINYDLICLTEGWSWTDRIHHTVFAEIAVPPARAHCAAIHIDSYAGFTDVPSVISRLWADVVENREPIPDKHYPDVFYERGKVLYIQDRLPRLSHQTPSYYATQKLVLLPADYARQCENKHVHSTHAGDDGDIYSVVAGEHNIRELMFGKHEWVFVAALDMAMESDLASICVVAYCEELEKAVEVETVTFHPPVSFIAVEDEVNVLRQRYPVSVLGLDIWQTGYLSQKWAFTRPVSQQSERKVADTLTYNWIRHKKLSLIQDGHVAKAYRMASKKSVGTETIRFIKSNESTSKIDPLIACSMALYCAVYPDRKKSKPKPMGTIKRRGIPMSGNKKDNDPFKLQNDVQKHNQRTQRFFGQQKERSKK